LRRWTAWSELDDDSDKPLFEGQNSKEGCSLEVSRDGISALSPERCLSAPWLGTHIPEDISLPVKAGDKHRPPVLVASWLVIRDNGRLISSRGHIAQGFAEAALTELVGAAEKLNRIVDAERSQQKLHGSIMLVAQWQDVGSHGGILASRAKQNRRTWPPVVYLCGEELQPPPRETSCCCRPAASALAYHRRCSCFRYCRACPWPRRAADWACWCPCYR
jgi:hypothetical protein